MLKKIGFIGLTLCLLCCLWPDAAAPARAQEAPAVRIIETASNLPYHTIDDFYRYGITAAYYRATEWGPTVWDYIDKTGKSAIPSGYDREDIGFEFFGGFIFEKNGKYGYVDRTGRVLIQPIYDSLFGEIVPHDVFYAGKDGKYGYISRTGEIIIPIIYDKVWSFTEGLAIVDYNGSLEIVEANGTVTYTQPHDPQDPYYPLDGRITDFSYGLACVRKDNKEGFIDKNGKIVVPFIYDFTDSWFYNGRCNVSVWAENGEDRLYGVVDTTGRVVIPLVYRGPMDFLRSDYSFMLRDGKAGVIDKNGKIIAPAKYNNARVCPKDPAYDQGLIYLCQNGKWGVWDLAGQTVIPFLYDDIGYFMEGRAWVKNAGKYGVIDLQGKTVAPMNYSLIRNYDSGYAICVRDSARYLLDRSGKEVLRLDYDMVSDFSYGLARVQKNGKWGIIQMVTNPSDWAVPEVEAAIQKNLVPEYLRNNYSRPVTRAEFCRLVIQMLESRTGKAKEELLKGKGMDYTAFYDIRYEWDTSYILAAQALDIVNGKGDHIFDPDGAITRQEAAAMLARAGRLLGLNPRTNTVIYADEKETASWAIESVGFVSALTDQTNGKAVMGGVGQNRFQPQGVYTREQAYLTMLRLFNAA